MAATAAAMVAPITGEEDDSVIIKRKQQN